MRIGKFATKMDVLGVLCFSYIIVFSIFALREEFDLVGKRYGRKFCSGIVVVTDKNKMIVCYDRGREYSLKPNRVKVVERTGAGDAFASGFVAGMIVGWDIDRCLKLGLKESESVIGHFGAKNNLLRMRLR